MKNNFKFLIVLSILLVGCICVGSTFAADVSVSDVSVNDVDNTQNIRIVHDDSSQKVVEINTLNTVSIENINALGATEQGNFTQLAKEITNCQNNTLVLNKNYCFNMGIDSTYQKGIDINKDNFVIDGNGYTIDGLGLARVFNIMGNNVTIKNINFINCNATEGGAIFWDGANGAVTGCNFSNCNATDGGAIDISGSVYAIWLWSSSLNQYEGKYGKFCENLSKYGINNIFLHVDNETISTKLSKLVEAGKPYGIKVHAWIDVFRKNGSWVNPVVNDSYNQTIFNNVMELAIKITKIDGIGGIHLDYFRYPANYGSQKKIDAITEFAKDFSAEVKKLNSDIILSAAVMPEIDKYNDVMTYDEYFYGQNVTALAKYLDVICPMVYKGNYLENTTWIESTTKLFIEAVNGNAEVWTGLQGYKDDNDPTPLSVEELTTDLNSAFYGGADGVILFRYGCTKLIDLPIDSCIVADCNFTNCTATNSGGAVFCNATNGAVCGSNFINCNATNGTAIYINGDSSLNIINSTCTPIDAKAPIYNDGTISSSVEITTIEGKVKNVNYGADVTLTGTVTASGIPVAGQKLTFKVNGNNISTESDETGLFSTKYSVDFIGEQYVGATYNGSTGLGSVYMGKLVANKINVIVTVVDVKGKAGYKVNFIAKVNDIEGNPVKNGTVIFGFNGKKYKTSVKNGIGTVKVVLPRAGTYSATAYYEGTNYNSSYTTFTVKVSNIPDSIPKPTPNPKPTHNSVNNCVGNMENTGNPLLVLLIALGAIGLESLRRKF